MLPRPPKDLARRTLPLDVLPAGTVLYRVHPVGLGPVWFGPGAGRPPTYRFDDPAGQYGVCYFGRGRMAAFVETMLRDLTTLVVSETNLDHRQISGVEVFRDLRVVRAHSEGLFQLGTTAALGGAKLEAPNTSPAQSYAHAMAWSRALHDHPAAPDGIAYRSSHDDALECVALFGDRAGEALAASGRPMRLSRLRSLLARAVLRYRIVLLPTMPG